MELPVKNLNLGTVYEADGVIVFKIEIINTGEKKLFLNRILSPGLTVRTMPKDGIMPGQKSDIIVGFNPFSSVGPIQKTITIFSNALNSPQQFIVSGKIFSGSHSISYRHKIGGAVFKQSQLNFGYIFKGEKVTRYFPVRNISNDALTLKFSEIPDYITVEPNFNKLAPNDLGILEVTYNTNLCSSWDFVIDKIAVEVDGDKPSIGFISLTSNIRENFDSIAQLDRNLHPIAEIPIKVFNFDTIPNIKVVDYNYLLVNSGSKQLNIRALKPTCGCTAALAGTNVVAPGDSTFIHVHFDPQGYSGMTKQGVSVITDDPLNYKQFLWITGVVKKIN